MKGRPLRLGKDFKVPANPCPCCNAKLDAATGILGPGLEGGTPDVGCYTICYSCGEILIIGIGLVLLKLSPAQIADAKTDTRWDTLQKLSRAALRAQAKRPFKTEPYVPVALLPPPHKAQP